MDTTAVLSQVPAGTDVVVVNAAGTTVPLASQEAAQIIANGDPMWCPSGITPGGASCSPHLTTFNDPSAATGLLAWLAAHNPTVNGVIWIAGSYVSSTAETTGPNAITIDGNSGTLGTMKNFTLTVNGGWTGTSTTINSALPSTFNNTTFSIINWNNDVTINDIEVKNIAAAGTAALTVTTTKNITLTRVHVHDNSTASMRGASLDNTITSGTGNVAVTSSEFDTNNGDNLYVLSNGTITLTNIIALGSTGGSGAILDNHLVGIATPKNVTVTGNNTFLTLAWINSGAGDFVNSFGSNFNDGLQVSSIGLITLNNITASYNGSSGGAHTYGAEVNNDFAGAASGVTLTGVNIFNNNNNDGLFIKSRGPVTASSVTASSNLGVGSGVEIDNHDAVSAQPVTLTGPGEFKYNDESGLSILSNGQITLNNLLADKNFGTLTPCPGNPNNPALSSCAGVYLYNSYGSYSSGVTITGTNAFNNNSNHGLHINSNGIVYLLTSTLTANNDGLSTGSGYAVYVDNSGAGTPKLVMLSGTNSMDQNSKGIYVTSKGAITVNSLSVTNTSNSDGALLKNDNAGAVGGVTLTGYNTFNYSFNGNGLKITSYGAISLSSLSADDNGYSLTLGAGIYLDNSASLLAVPPGITLSGTNLSSNNGKDGVFILTKGAVTINSLTAGSNGFAATGGSGLNLDNTSGTGGVTLTGTNAFNNNYSNGLTLTSRGSITLSNITAYSNAHGTGANLGNTASGTGSPQNVTIAGTNSFSYNNSDGLVIHTYGIISLNNVTAISSTTGNGAYLNNSTGFTVKSVTLTGTNSFNYNFVDGLRITSLGQITASNLNASYNSTGRGTYLDNQLGTAGVTLSGTNVFNYNPLATGLLVLTRGAITINSLTAGSDGSGVGQYGVSLDNSGGTAQPVTLTGTNTFNNNYDSGLFLKSTGLVTLYNLTAKFNGTTGGSHGYGLEISNLANNTGVYMYGSNIFYHNYSGGLVVPSKGPITLYSVSATNSMMVGSIGAMLDNTASGASTPQNVTIFGTNDFRYNDGDGLDIKTYGAISLYNVTSGNSTTGSGAILDNGCVNLGSGCTATLARAVTLTGTNMFNNNHVKGLDVTSLGQITVSNLTASSNATGRGASFDNSLGTAGVTLSGTNALTGNSQATGLLILTRGAIILNNVTANYNGNASSEYGVSLDNSGGTAQPVTLTGTNTFNNNYDSGLFLKSSGLVTLYNLMTNFNGTTGGLHGYGLEISNLANNTGVYLFGSSIFYHNYSGGLVVPSKGPITLYSVSATYSTMGGSIGAMLDNTASGASTPQNVTITGSNYFGYNDGDGLDIKTYGAISLYNVVSRSSNTGNGAVLCQTLICSAKSVALTGTNIFNNNHKDGLDILTLGGVTSTSSLQADNNGINGVQLNAVGNVTLSGTNEFYSNTAGFGLSIVTSGAISLNNVTGNSNGSFGATLNNSTGTAQPVTLTGTNQFSYNQTNGIYIRTKGAVTLAGLTAASNDQSLTVGIFGADISNWSGTAGVSLTGTGVFTANHDQGLYIESKGAITLNNITANSNSKAGVSLVNATEGLGVTLTGTSGFSGNGDAGLAINSLGAINVNNVTSLYNKAIGVLLDNSTAGSARAVNITGINQFSNTNPGGGLSVLSRGAITLSNITANGNSGAGVTLDNHLGNAAVTLTGINTFLYNHGSGLVITSQGNISLTKIRSDGNLSSGDGVNINTTGTVMLTCGSLDNNARYGVNIAAAVVTLTGVVSSGNSFGDVHVTGTLTRVRVCPLP